MTDRAGSAPIREGGPLPDSGGYERKSARFRVSGTLLAAALKMPPDAIVLDVAKVEDYDQFEIVVSHPDLPESDQPTECEPTVTHKREEFVWDWNIA